MIAGLLNQVITIYPETSYNSQGREVVGTGVTVKARIQPKQKTRLKPNGEVQVIDAKAYVLPSITVNIDDRVDYGSFKYKVVSKYPVPDGLGNTDHIELELALWQKT